MTETLSGTPIVVHRCGSSFPVFDKIKIDTDDSGKPIYTVLCKVFELDPSKEDLRCPEVNLFGARGNYSQDLITIRGNLTTTCISEACFHWDDSSRTEGIVRG